MEAATVEVGRVRSRNTDATSNCSSLLTFQLSSPYRFVRDLFKPRHHSARVFHTLDEERSYAGASLCAHLSVRIVEIKEWFFE